MCARPLDQNSARGNTSESPPEQGRKGGLGGNENNNKTVREGRNAHVFISCSLYLMTALQIQIPCLPCQYTTFEFEFDRKLYKYDREKDQSVSRK